MTGGQVVALIEQVGLPLVLAAIGATLAWRLGGKLLGALIDGYRERIAALDEERDHFRDRSERAEDRTAELCREMIDALRKGASHE
jgi:hypothetical protein